ncbi:hypothetical protein DLM75_01350 [Leptospira stimsonii]|uniref:Uncharacterized protein n=1 Tax=Leptospira stimsonii TaxID=2202203 RepID=A0A396ZDF6_9LEPT|nr:hypothetical protein DLM75_01350 [Leptospira stimsonii]
MWELLRSFTRLKPKFQKIPFPDLGNLSSYVNSEIGETDPKKKSFLQEILSQKINREKEFFKSYFFGNVFLYNSKESKTICLASFAF